jgi:PiT family inorganic phosphate transporter
MSILILIGILIALLFNFVNGLNGAANSVATVTATRVLRPRQAIALAAIFNVFGPFLFTAAIARTLGEGILNSSRITPLILLIAILSASALVVIATFSALPISSTHALVGGLVGAGFAFQGLGILILPDPAGVATLLTAMGLGAALGIPLFILLSLLYRLPLVPSTLAGLLLGVSLAVPSFMVTGLLPLSGLLTIIIFIFISPTLGFLSAFVFDIVISLIFRHSRQNLRKHIFSPLHVLASVFQAASHGGHDGQHAIAIITALLLAEGLITSFSVPSWVTASSAAAIGLGTLFGGWDVIDRVAKKITRIRPYQGFSAAASGGIILSSMITVGVPVSTTYVISGTIVGVGVTRGRSAVQWRVFRTILAGWLITIPLAFLFSWVLARAALMLFPLAG